MSPGELPSRRPQLGSRVTPVLRAVLLADLVDSTGFVQRFGDARAAVALQRLDLQIRDLLEFTGGRLIDKADGLLALFERPVQAVDFALRYQQALRHFSSSEGVKLTARVGIHVGELMTWSNSADAIAAGAKPLEVEGLAKPIAARLMALALPGQILISSMAMTLAQRAEAELGERAQRVRWLAHGRYRFKGVPTPLIVHEVGETGFAPLRQPPSGSKVWREQPIWRRPPVLVAELLVFLGLGGFYAYGLLRSPPALAFNERDWVVVGDISNFTGDPRLEESLETALRISLEQSRFVNAVPELKVQEVLQRMGRSQQASVDRAIGSEIALREGARALLLPSVAEVGGRLRVSVEVVDPSNQATVLAQSAEGRGADSALASIDKVTGALRAAMGESLASVKTSGKPLAMVTTGNLDALRAYSLATATYYQSRDKEALALFEQALQIDPQFAMAQVGIARIRARNGEIAEARRLALQANANRARLTQREAIELDAFIARFGPPTEAMAKYRLWAAMYPDAFRPYYGYSILALENNAYREALDFLAPALSAKNPMQGNAYFLQGAILLPLNRYDEALVAFQRADTLGVGGEKLEYAETYAARRDFAAARRVLQTQTRSGMPVIDSRLSVDDHIFLLDQGLWKEGKASLAALRESQRADSPAESMLAQLAQLSLDAQDGTLTRAALRQFVDARRAEFAGTDEVAQADALFPMLAAGVLAAQSGDLVLARQVLQRTDTRTRAAGDAASHGMRAILQAGLALAEGTPARAVALLNALNDGHEPYYSHALLMRAYAAAGNQAAALAEAQWLMRERGRAYGEWNLSGSWSAANVVESDLAMLVAAELSLKLGQPKLAQRHLSEFLRAWPQADRLSFVQPRLRAVREGLGLKPVRP